MLCRLLTSGMHLSVVATMLGSLPGSSLRSAACTAVPHACWTECTTCRHRSTTC